ncbi:eukaryotic translation initiation factor 3 subunit D [Jimgerdemannia flammicorona]|uniref:Eukaryotic translation initiation factor 3 subunit D n=1 Tax=Jimgerdemannia flammicorona TaxID=994334 RepID=A0A433QHG0_9FUNG|nr:eukaryotic translation initiation factor 3 subunit D [Jimgerdemannia flammicorona]
MRDASVNVGPDWRVLDEIDFVRLSKLNFNVAEPEDVATYGFVNYYDKSYDRVNTHLERQLQHIDRVKYETTTSDDPVIQQFIKDGEATVFATDSILALLMCSPRTAYPWDIVINRIDDRVVFDKREGGVFDYVTVNENTADPPMETGDKDNINSPSALSMEATFINQHFAFQVINEEEKYEFENPNPFAVEDNEPLASCGYRYRRFDLTTKQAAAAADDEEEPDEVTLIVRTEVDAAVANPNLQGGEPTFITVHALNEFDPKAQGAGNALDWRQKLDMQRGAVVATEMKNNSAKLARWAVQAILAGADQMKLGYITRANPKDNNRHAILGTQSYKPREFAGQMNVTLTNGWGIVKAVVDMCLRLPEGKYVLVKDPNKSILRFYSVPIHTFEEESHHVEEEEQHFEEEEPVDAEK